MSFEPAKAKLTIGSLDKTSLTVKAQYNPKELQVDQSVPWKKPDSANKTGSQGGSGGGDGGIALEFTGAEGRSMSVELLFDGYEGSGRSVNVAGQVAILEELAAVMDPKSKDEKKRRPHHCVISWGDRGLPKFQCVIESLSTKYSMFSSEGQPLRATCTVKLKEATSVDKKGKK
ncbi:MAG: hypothetical protein H0T89_33275 [Deltaproteobacteria bacterium]|nr:hypothetical protein [Deltaproteobacteria bacterium]MDQ3299611.1 hypothetical protein [Myxococcota bacterium]